MRTRILLLIALALVALPSVGFGQDAGLAGEMQELSFIGFQQFKDVSRVFVKTTETAKYRVDNTRPDMIVLMLDNTTIPLKNNRRQLDTRYFDSPVSYIQARAIEGPSPSVRVEIRLRRKVPFNEAQNDNVLALDFQRL